MKLSLIPASLALVALTSGCAKRNFTTNGEQTSYTLSCMLDGKNRGGDNTSRAPYTAGFDASEFQHVNNAPIFWDEVTAAKDKRTGTPYRFVMLRVAGGERYRDSSFIEDWKKITELKREGKIIARAAYQYMIPKQPGDEQARTFLQRLWYVNDLIAGKKMGLLSRKMCETKSPNTKLFGDDCRELLVETPAFVERMTSLCKEEEPNNVASCSEKKLGNHCKILEGIQEDKQCWLPILNVKTTKSSCDNLGKDYEYSEKKGVCRPVALETTDLPPVTDIEVNSKADIDALSEADINWIFDQSQKWLDIVEEATHKRPFIYTLPLLWFKFEEVSPRAKLKGSYPLWLSHFRGDPETGCPWLPSTWKAWTMWQASDQGKIPGIGAAVDIDYYAGTEESLKEFIRNNDERTRQKVNK